MRDELLYPLNQVLLSSDFLLKETILHDLQRKFLHSIHTVATDMQHIIVMTPSESLTIERARELFSYETRELLSSMIGYAEVLESEEDGELSQIQHEHIANIHANAIELLDVITTIIQ
jgi:hypothetical protein